MQLYVWLILLINSAWNFLSFLAICVGGPFFQSVANMHLGLWLDPVDQANPAAVYQMSFFMLTLGTSRICACIDENMKPVAVFSYIIEFAFAAAGVYLGLLHTWKGVFVLAFSVLLAVVIAWPVPTPSAAP